MSAKRLRPLPLAAAIAWAGWIFWLSSQPARVGPIGWFWDFARNGGHAFLYAVLALLLLQGLPGEARWRRFALVAALLYAASDEWHQSFVPNRDATLTDWWTDAAGVAFGAGVYGWCVEWRRSGLRTAWSIWGARCALRALLCVAAALVATLA